MPYLAVDKSGDEYLHYMLPYRNGSSWLNYDDILMEMPKGSIERLIGRPLSWDDAPVELTQDSLTPKS